MDYTLNSNDRLQLDQMLKANDVEDKTELIRATRHSSIIRDEVTRLESFKKKKIKKCIKIILKNLIY
tara:strand:- start:1339 stop:1539 length:201 start_codon:yes stop_codon:yes gene_type:complete